MTTAILTSYFTEKQHPQAIDPSIIGLNKQGFVSPDSRKYSERWINSIKDKNVEAFIFYDNLSQTFIESCMDMASNLTFVQVSNTDFSNNDQRFFFYKKFLDGNPFDKVFMTDLCDVIVAKDPSTMDVTSHESFFCEDTLNITDYYFMNLNYFDFHNNLKWQDETRFRMCNFKLLNMGVIGGNGHNIDAFLDYFLKERLEAQNPHLNMNMPLGNYIARQFFMKVKSGEGFCSEYKQNQIDRDDVYFIHK